MTITGIFGETISLLEKSLNLRALQQRVLASNIANIDTPNYKAVELEVSAEMDKTASPDSGVQLTRTQTGHLPMSSHRPDTIRLKTAQPPDVSLRGDGNTVDLDRTMGKLAENTLFYRTAAQLISSKFSGLRSAIKGGS